MSCFDMKKQSRKINKICVALMDYTEKIFSSQLSQGDHL